MSKERHQHDDTNVVLDRKVVPKVKPPRMYKVLLHTDDYTTMEFVVAVLETVFHHSNAAAMKIMLHIHHQGVGVAGVFTHEVAESKVAKVMALAREAQYPLLCTLEPET